ncbi:hypothetical protein B0H16DRAFT_1807649 [Mycena metata]|uniref:C2H2-type domain-containing protein n=1 Tax=Mycena metata TaxID=1033252 RepID=A0AAD7H8M4_9AGAR|nr:hypothetical protein B0H16DRAFT_1807649 [Mycena metata]
MPNVRRQFSADAFPCPQRHCNKRFKTSGGLRKHREDVHDMRRPRIPSPYREDSPPLNNSPPVSPPLSPGPDPPPSPPPVQATPLNRRGEKIDYHPILDGTPCDRDGYDLPPGTPPPPWEERAADDFSPFNNRAEFEFADFLYREEEMAGRRVDRLSQLLAALYGGKEPPFADHKDLYSTIDAIQQGDVPWQSFSVTYTGPLPTSGVVPAWMTEKYEVWFRSPLGIFERQLANPDFKDEMDWAPKRMFKDGKRQYVDLFSGNWAWEQADKIAEDEDTHGSMFVPGVLGSDKTTVSVGTGNTEFYPLYGGIGNIYNSTRRAHREGLAVMAFLSIPKTTRDHAGSTAFRKFRRQLFHSSLHKILLPLKPHMTTPRITRCADGHFRRVVYGLGPYIADYPEQALLTCIVQNWCPRCLAPTSDLDCPSSNRSHEHTDALMEGCTLKELWDDFGIVGDLIPFTTGFPRADIHELISTDLLHQIIKGTFKDHVVDWVETWIRNNHDKAEADKILADIDRRIAITPPFPGLRHFHTGRGYKHWTGNDSKGLMKVYLPAIAGHVPAEVVQTVTDIVEFCHLVRRSVIDEDTLNAIDACVANFHRHREVFRATVRPEGFSLPRQHSIVHDRPVIQLFGAPNGLCSSITESKHIKAVKKPYRRSSHNKPLSQILLTNQRLDKLAAARVDFAARGMLDGPLLAVPPRDGSVSPEPDPDDDRVDSGAIEGPTCIGEVKLAKTYVRKVPRDVHQLAMHMEQPRLHELIRRFLFDQLNPNAPIPGGQIPLAQCPTFAERVFLYNSARAVFYAPSDFSGVGGMHHERIRATKSWYRGPARFDCVFLEHDTDEPGFRGLHAARVRMFFRFKYRGKDYPCALIHWFSVKGERPCPETGMWVVTPDSVRGGGPSLAVVHLDCLLRGAHLIGVAGRDFIPIHQFDFSDSLDAFKAFYVNKYADHHAHEIAF